MNNLHSRYKKNSSQHVEIRYMNIFIYWGPIQLAPSLFTFYDAHAVLNSALYLLDLMFLARIDFCRF